MLESELSSIEHQASNTKHQASSIKHQIPSIKHQASSIHSIMLDFDSKKWLSGFLNGNVRFNEPMSGHTSFRVGGPADAYITPETGEELVNIIKGARQREIEYVIVGGGTNLLVKDKGVRGIVIALKKGFNKIIQTKINKDGVIVTAMAGSGLGRLCNFAIEHGLEGMNFAIGIPGTVGGAVMMNAGTAYGSMESVLESVNILLPTGRTERIKRENLKFDYRKLDIVQSCINAGASSPAGGQPVILDGRFCLHPSDPVKLKKEAARIMNTRREKQPTGFPNAGCFFKNPGVSVVRGPWSVVSGPLQRTTDNRQPSTVNRQPSTVNWQPSTVNRQPSAGELIERAGLKGKRIGGAEISAKHANFIINRKRASAADILAAAELIQETVSKMFGIHLETEVRILGE
ncbi:UDP-N-acetylmuramate dehydrogenase [Desulfobacterales bacterium HSG2]|nr:UDP-N-acetylmuramate dehydrogenase [Desulfobacterales bacterium HSG2]